MNIGQGLIDINNSGFLASMSAEERHLHEVGEGNNKANRYWPKKEFIDEWVLNRGDFTPEQRMEFYERAADGFINKFGEPVAIEWVKQTFRRIDRSLDLPLLSSHQGRPKTYGGTYYVKSEDKYRPQVKIKGKITYLGRYPTYEAAESARIERLNQMGITL